MGLRWNALPAGNTDRTTVDGWRRITRRTMSWTCPGHRRLRGEIVRSWMNWGGTRWWPRWTSQGWPSRRWSASEEKRKRARWRGGDREACSTEGRRRGSREIYAGTESETGAFGIWGVSGLVQDRDTLEARLRNQGRDASQQCRCRETRFFCGRRPYLVRAQPLRWSGDGLSRGCSAGQRARYLVLFRCRRRVQRREG